MEDAKPLDTEVRDLLESRRGDWKQIAAESKVSYSWISQFVRGKIPNPGFATLTQLRDYLLNATAKAA
jgi:transcriptional regulator with XRE-family HTH domain